MSAELLPCPCGKPCNTEEGPYPIGRAGTMFRLTCIDAECGWSVVAESPEEAFRIWNRRVTMERYDAITERD